MEVYEVKNSIAAMIFQQQTKFYLKPNHLLKMV